MQVSQMKRAVSRAQWEQRIVECRNSGVPVKGMAPGARNQLFHLMGKGLGGRNQEIALAAASQIEGIQNVAVFSFGSDGTDGPTDAAGGYVDGKTSRLVDIDAALKASDSYHALQKSGGLLVTGPTGTNVNDLAVVLIN